MTKKRPRTIAREIVRTLPLNDGDVVMIKRSAAIHDDIRMFNAIRNAIGATGRENCIVVVVNDFDEINTIPKSEMLSYGWKWVGKPEEDSVEA